MKFLRRHTAKPIKMTVPGPFTMSQQAQNEFLPDIADAAMDYADAVNAEIKDLFAAGADIVQIDEPYLQARPEIAERYGVEALNRALEGVTGTTAVHLCFGYAAIVHDRPSAYSFLPQLARCRCQQISIETAQPNLDCSVLQSLPEHKIMVGTLDLSTHEVETPEIVAARIRKALKYRKAEDIIVAPDCGLKYLPREVAFGKMKAMVEGAKIVRGELVGLAIERCVVPHGSRPPPLPAWASEPRSPQQRSCGEGWGGAETRRTLFRCICSAPRALPPPRAVSGKPTALGCRRGEHGWIA